jgi:hypothetical protein
MLCAGEGIHTAMIAGKVSAQSVADMFQACNFTLNACRAYGEFGHCHLCFDAQLRSGIILGPIELPSCIF